MNLPNKLTLARIGLVPFFILFMELQGVTVSVLALLVFSAASLTDLFDGKIARKYNTVTPLGIFLDPLADKLLISAAFICFVDIPYLGIPAWMVIAIISREFLITGLRTIAASKNVIIPADKSGKLKTTSQMIVIILVLLIVIFKEVRIAYNIHMFANGQNHLLLQIITKTPFWAVLIATILTLYSGFNYMFKHRELLKENA